VYAAFQANKVVYNIYTQTRAIENPGCKSYSRSYVGAAGARLCSETESVMRNALRRRCPPTVAITP